MSSMTKEPTNTAHTEQDNAESERELALLEARQLKELGSIERTQSNYKEALRCFHQALSIFRAHKASADEGIVLGNIGSVHREQGYFEQATEYVNEGLALVRLANDKRGEGSLLGIFGNIYRAQGNHERAVALFTEALDISRQIGDVHTEGINLGNLGCVYQAQGQHEIAIQMHSQALTISQTYGDGGNEGINRGNMGDALFGMNRLEEAEQSLRLAIQMGDETSKVIAGVFRGSLALLLATQGHFGEAQILLKEGEEQIKTYPEEYAKYLVKKGQVRHLSGDIKGARASLARVQALASELKVRDESEVGLAIHHLTKILNRP